MTTKPTCDMYADCGNRISHIGEKGYVYCAAHVGCRQGVERCRLLRPFELRLLQSGHALPSYKPLSEQETLQRLFARKGAHEPA